MLYSCVNFEIWGEKLCYQKCSKKYLWYVSTVTYVNKIQNNHTATKLIRITVKEERFNYNIPSFMPSLTKSVCAMTRQSCFFIFRVSHLALFFPMKKRIAGRSTSTSTYYSAYFNFTGMHASCKQCTILLLVYVLLVQLHFAMKSLNRMGRRKNMKGRLFNLHAVLHKSTFLWLLFSCVYKT